MYMLMNFKLIIMVIGLFMGLRKILDLVIKRNIQKRNLFISVLIATIHSFAISCISMYVLLTNKQSIMEQPAFAFSAGYFIYDGIGTYLYLNRNRNNLISMIHHLVALAIIGSRSMYPELMPFWIGICFLLTELTMPTLNLQWIIETYYENHKTMVLYKNLFRFNMLLYMIVRIGICYYGFICSVYYKYILCIVNFFPLVIFNTLWFYQLVKKYLGIGIEIF